MKSQHGLLFGISVSIGLTFAHVVTASVLPAQREVQFDIERSSLREALAKFSDQSDLQLFAHAQDTKDMEGVVVGPLQGRYPVEQGLKLLLLDSGVVYSLINERAIGVKKALGDGERPSDAQLPLRQSTNTPEVYGPEHQLESIIVHGASMPAEIGLPKPDIVIDRQTIDQLGASSLAGVLKILTQQPYNSEGRRASGAQYPELRGLGPGTSVIVIDGLPVAAFSGDAADAFDLNSIPVAAVKEIEITLDPPPASNASAVGGYINVILDKDHEHPTIDLKYAAANGGAGERKVSAAGTHTIDGVKATLVMEHQQRDFLLGDERSIWRDQNYERFGGRDYRSPYSCPGNIRSLDGENLPGLTSPHAALSAQNTTNRVTPNDLSATSGLVNHESLTRFYSVAPKIKRGSVMSMIESEFGDMIASAEFLYTGNEITQQYSPPILSDVLVPADNPSHAFGVPLIFDGLLAGLPPQQVHTESELVRSVLGLRGMSGSWRWRLSLINTHDDVSVTSPSSISAERVSAAMAVTEKEYALNILKPDRAGSYQLLQWLVGEPSKSSSSSDTALFRTTLAGKFNGPLGEVTASFGIDYERTRSSFAEIAQQALQRQTSAAFAEFRLPLGNPDLNLTVGTRLDHLSDVGNLSSSQYVVSWKLGEEFALAASYGQSARAPTLLEQMRPRYRTQMIVVDTNRNSEVRGVDVIVGGNPDLSPMTSASWSFAATFESDSYGLTAKYWSISLEDQILVPSLPRLLDPQGYFADRVERAARTEADIEAGLPGALRLLDFSRVNSGQLDTRGVDFIAFKSIEAGPLGAFSGRLMATWVDKYATADVAHVPGTDRVGIASMYGTIPEWKAVALLKWESSSAWLTTTVRYSPSYADAYLEPTGRTIPSQTIVDVEASYRFGDSRDGRASPNLRLSVGVLNVFDESPAFAQVGYAAGFDVSQGDLVQRVGYLRLQMSF